MADSPEIDLTRTFASAKERFDAARRVLSFAEHLQLLATDPRRHTRDAARYVVDCFDHYGEEPGVGARPSRFKLFDLPFEEKAPGRRSDRLVGHEETQHAVRGVLENFTREGMVNRLVMLHGPNGSAKSTFVHCVMRALEHYSTLDEGAQYCFSWIFPRGRDGRTLGFGSTDDSMAASATYAHLPDANIDLRIASELRESPLLLLPVADRREIVGRAYAAHGVMEPAPKSIWEGQLGQKNRMIFEALLTAYRGDLSRVLSHVRVERFFISMRYRQGAVTVGPQMAVDASERQITADRSLAALPASLAALALYEAHGELVDASGGVLEFSDLLKRPLDAWRYLLLAVEEGEIALPTSVLPLNTVLLATSNDVHLKAFREHHEYKSFRGRLSLVRVPYLLDWRAEESVYAGQIAPQIGGHVAPHAIYIAALWAVLTRLRRPKSEHYDDKKLGNLASQLTPVEKAELYEGAVVPTRFGNDEAQELRAGIDLLRHEHDGEPQYEGSTGASAREVRVLLLDAAQDERYDGLSPLAVLERIVELTEEADYDFLKEPPDGGYQDHRALVEVVRGRWLDRVEVELRRASGLVDESQYVELFDKYVTHVSYWLKKERVPNPLTGRDDEPDVKLMENVEAMLGITRNQESVRRDLISAVAAHAIDHPGERPSYPKIFSRQLEQLREATYASRKKQIAELAEDILRTVSGGAAVAGIDPLRIQRAERTLERMVAQHGYTRASARDVVAEILARRYV